MHAYLFTVLLGAILANQQAYGVRIVTDKIYGILPSEQKLEFFNAFTPEQPPPVMEDPEPENRLLPQGPARAPGFQIENAVQALRYRYPDPSTTPRPNSPAARAMLPPNLPSAYARPRPPSPPIPLAPTYSSPNGNFIIGNQINPLLAFSNPDLYQQQLVQQQQQAQAFQQQQNQIQLAQQRRQQQQQQQQLQQMQQQQQDAFYQQQIQPPFISQPQDMIQPQISSPLIHQQPQIFSELQSSPLTQQQSPPVGGISYTRTYHVSRVTDH